MRTIDSDSDQKPTRTARINIRTYHSFKANVEAAAARLGMDVTTYIEMACTALMAKSGTPSLPVKKKIRLARNKVDIVRTTL